MENKCTNCSANLANVKEIYKTKKQILPKVCLNCKKPSPRQSMRSGKPTRK